jgi:hypothetical protein
MSKPVRVVDPNVLSSKVARMVRALAEGATYLQLVEVSGLNRNTVEQWVGAFHNAGMAHIAHIAPDRTGALKVRVMKLGPGPDYTPITKHQLRTKATLDNAMHGFSGGNIRKHRNFVQRLHQPPSTKGST